MMTMDDSSEEYDREELEVALYSQIHFGSDSKDTVQKSNKHRLSSRLNRRKPYNVGIEELPLRVVQASKKMSLSKQDFIAFSDEPESPHDDVGTQGSNEQKTCRETGEKDNEQETCRETGQKESKYTDPASVASALEIAETIKDLKTEVLDFVIDGANQRVCKQEKEPDDILEDAVGGKSMPGLSKVPIEAQDIKMEVKTEEQADDELHEHSDEVLNLLQDDTPEQFMVDGDIMNDEDNAANPRNDRNEKAVSKSSNKDKNRVLMKSKDDLLPSTITKTASQMVEPAPKKTAQKKQEASKTNASQLKDFLRLPESSGASEEEIKLWKNRKISKQDAAVRPVKPPVKLRRGPAVVVKYREHSDTDTEYSDSDSSEQSQQQKEVPRDAAQEEASVMEEADVEDKVEALEASDIKEEDEEIVDESEETDGDESDDESSSDSSELVSESSLLDGQLEFNLDGGLNSLLKASKSEESEKEKWQINEKDRFSVTSTMSRYFCPRKITCRNCDEEGHLSRDCPKPLSRRCIFCGNKGHVFQNCPDAICHNCGAPGHRANQCDKPRRNRWEMCSRCQMKGHNVEVCPDKLRQYHKTVKSKCLWPMVGKKWQNPRVYCYNCGHQGHLGHVCTAPRMNVYIIPSSPFVVHYDSYREYKNEQKMIRRRIKRQQEGHIEQGKRAGKLTRKNQKRMHMEQSGQYSSRPDYMDDYDDRTHQTWSKRHKRSDRDYSGEYGDHYESRDYAGGRDRGYSNRDEMYGKGRSAEWSSRKRERISDEGSSKDRAVTVRFESLEVSIPQGGVKKMRRSRMKEETGAYGKPWPPRGGHTKPGGQQEVNDHRGSSGGKTQGSEFKQRVGREDGEITDDDMEGYQVDDNEWWKKPESKRCKGRRERESERRTRVSPREQQYQRERYAQDKYSWQRDGREPRDSSFEERQRQPSSSTQSFKRQRSYDAAFPRESFGFRYEQDFSTPTSTYESRKRKHPLEGRRDSGSFPARKSALLPTPSDRRGGLSHSRSWPSLKKNRNASGFQPQNSRFIQMSNDYNMSVNVRR